MFTYPAIASSDNSAIEKMEIKIRPAHLDEINILYEFEKGVVKAERPYDSTLREGDIHYYDLVSLMHSPDSEVLVAKANGQIVGSGYATIKTALPFLKHTHFAYLGFMYVLPEFRGNGINQKIVEALINWAKSRGITEIRLEVYDENTTAKQAYLKAGFKPNLLEMRKSI